MDMIDMTKFSHSEWFDNGAMIAGEKLQGQDRTDYILCNIADEIRTLRESIEEIAFYHPRIEKELEQ